MMGPSPEMKFLIRIHQICGIILLFSMFIPNRNIKVFLYFAIATILASWILFDGCVLWDLQKMVDPTFNTPTEPSGRKLGMSKKTRGYAEAILTYTNFIVLGYQIDRLPEALTIMIIYMVLNGEILTKPFIKILSNPTD